MGVLVSFHISGYFDISINKRVRLNYINLKVTPSIFHFMSSGTIELEFGNGEAVIFNRVYNYFDMSIYLEHFYNLSDMQINTKCDVGRSEQPIIMLWAW